MYARYRRVVTVRRRSASGKNDGVLRRVAVELELDEAAHGRATPELAREVWRGLLEGEWRLIDQFDREDRRFLIARHGTGAAERLTGRERQVVEHALRGHANKVAAYELGLTESTVATHLRRAMAKLNVDSRVDLIRALGSFDEMTMERDETNPE